MSFILDALKKSETERQQQTGAEFSSVPSSSGESQSFKWLWILGLLLLVNIAVLIGVLLRPDPVASTSAPAKEAVVEETSAAQAAPADPSFEERVAAAAENQTISEPPATDVAQVPATVAESAPVAAPSVTSSGPRIRTIDELRLDGTLQLPDLHLDIHVYADDPAERFVFINMKKHRENSQLAEGPVVSEITNDGVILEHRGSTFLLPRE